MFGAQRLLGTLVSTGLGGLRQQLTQGAGFVGATIGAVIILAIYHMVVRARAPNPDGEGRRRWF